MELDPKKLSDKAVIKEIQENPYLQYFLGTERFFSTEKRCNGAGLIITKLEETTLSSIAMSVLVTNLFAVDLNSIFLLYFSDNISSEKTEHDIIIIDDVA